MKERKKCVRVVTLWWGNLKLDDLQDLFCSVMHVNRSLLAN